MWPISLPRVAAVLADEQSVKLLLNNGANANVWGTRAIPHLDMAIFEEHEALIQHLLAADEDSKSEIFFFEDNEPGDSAEGEFQVLRFTVI